MDVRFTGHEYDVGNEKFVGTPEMTRPLQDGIEDVLKIGPKEQGVEIWQAFVNSAMDIRFSYKAGKSFVTEWVTISFSRTLLQRIRI